MKTTTKPIASAKLVDKGRSKTVDIRSVATTPPRRDLTVVFSRPASSRAMSCLRGVIWVSVSWLDALQRNPVRSAAEIQLVRTFVALEDLVWAFIGTLQWRLDFVDPDENEVCALQGLWEVDDLLRMVGALHRLSRPSNLADLL